jgi:hypothetical protein
MTPRLSILIPVRIESPWRKLIYYHVIPQWQALDVDLCVGIHDGPEPFNNSAALNRARAQARTDLLAVFTLDTIPPPQTDLDHLADFITNHPWTRVYDRTLYLDRANTKAVLIRHEPPNPAGGRIWTFCPGLVAMRADVFDDVGGYPEAFCGWGYEDAAMRRALIALHGEPPDPPLDMTAQLWHPRSTRANEDRNRAMFEVFDAAKNDPDLMRQVIAEHRKARM